MHSPQSHAPQISAFFFLRNTTCHSLARSGKVDGMVSNLQDFPPGTITITNKTPYVSPVSFLGMCLHHTFPTLSILHLVSPIIVLIFLTAEIHGLQTNVRVVWWGELMPCFKAFPMGIVPITGSSVLRMMARGGRVCIQAFLF